MCVCKHAHARGSGGMLPQENLHIRCSEIVSEATFGPLQLSLLSVHLRIYDSNSYARPHAMQWPLLKSPNFRVSSAEYYIGLLSLA